MDRPEIDKIVRGAVGDPSVGAVADAIPAIVDALAAALAPKADEKITRVVKATETR